MNQPHHRPAAAHTAASARALFVALALFCVGGPQAAHAIVGGAEEHGPARASTLMVLGSDGGVCSAVVVSPRAVLTAAHCADPAREHRVHFMDNGAPALLTPSASATHPDYVKSAVRERRQSVDLALIQLAQPLPARFAPADLSTGPQPRAGDMVTISGFGAVGKQRADGQLRSVTVPVTEPWGRGRILLWVDAPRGRMLGACAGDSGGPIAWGDAVTALTVWSKGARGQPCGQTTQGVLLAPQRRWIDDTLASWGLRANWK